MDYKRDIVKTVVYSPLTVDQVARQCRVVLAGNPDAGISSELDDVRLDAINAVEEYIHADISHKSCVLTDVGDGEDIIKIADGHFKELTEVKVNDVVIDTAKYDVYSDNHYIYVEFDGTVDTTDLSVVISYATGFAEGAMPRGLRRGLLITCNDLYTTERSSYGFALGANIAAYNSAEKYLKPFQLHYY
jgi:hypothetical protein